VRSSLRAELIVELQIQDSVVAGRTPLELAYVVAGGAAGWVLLQLPGPFMVRAAVAALLAITAATFAFVRVAGQDLTTWGFVLGRYLATGRIAPYGSCDPR